MREMDGVRKFLMEKQQKWEYVHDVQTAKKRKKSISIHKKRKEKEFLENDLQLHSCVHDLDYEAPYLYHPTKA